MPKRLCVIKLVPPQTTGAPIPACVYPPANVPDRSVTPVPPAAFAPPIAIAESEAFHFWLVASGPVTSGNVCPVTILPLGWIGGNCPPNLQIFLGDTGEDKLREYGLAVGAGATACRVMRCCFNGKGILTCESSAITLTLDLTASTYSQGVYITLAPDDPVPVKIIYSDSRLPTWEF